MEIIEAKEHGRIPIDLGPSVKIRRDVIKHEWVAVRTGEKDWDDSDTSYTEIPRALFAGSMAGLLPLSEDISVLVTPKHPASLTLMLNALDQSAQPIDLIREYEPLLDEDPADWMLRHIVDELLKATNAVVAQGLHRQYVRKRSITSSPKGRILAGRTMALQARGIDFKAEAEYHSRTESTPPNQALLEALHWCLRWVDRRSDMELERERTVALLHALRFVDRDQELHFKQDRVVRHASSFSESRSAYRRALPLALALLERRGFSLDAADGELAMSSLLVKTNDVFEDFVRLRLADYLPDQSLLVVNGRTMEERKLFERPLPDDKPEGAELLPPGRNSIEPDVLIEDAARTRLVIDVKYKGIEGHAGRADIEQLVTFAHRLDCRRAVSIHPADEGKKSGLYVSGRIGTTTLYSYRINLGAEDLEEEMRDMAVAVGSLC